MGNTTKLSPRRSTGAAADVRDMLGPETLAKLETLCTPHPLLGYRDVAWAYTFIAVVISVCVMVGGLTAAVAGCVYIGVRQRRLSNLAHECIHVKLVPSPLGNRFFGHLITTTLGEGFEPYRASHGTHHGRLGDPGDPMLDSYTSLNAIGPWTNRRQFILVAIIKNALWRLPRDAATKLVPRLQEEGRVPALTRTLVWVAVITGAALTGTATELLWYWVLPLLVVRPLMTWLTDIGNHLPMITNQDPVLQTRGWDSHLVTRHLLGGHLDDMYHPVHHLCPNITWRALPAAAQILSEELTRWPDVPWCSGYLFRRRATPDVPSVFEDIVTRSQHTAIN